MADGWEPTGMCATTGRALLAALFQVLAFHLAPRRGPGLRHGRRNRECGRHAPEGGPRWHHSRAPAQRADDAQHRHGGPAVGDPACSGSVSPVPLHALGKGSLRGHGMNDEQGFERIGVGTAGDVVQVQIGDGRRDNPSLSIDHRMVEQGRGDAPHDFASWGSSRSARRSRVRSNVRSCRHA